MKHLIIADLHICGARLEDFLAQRDALLRHRIPVVHRVFLAGDVFDKAQLADRYASAGAIASEANVFIREMKQVGFLSFYAITGNGTHEWVGTDPGQCAVQAIASDCCVHTNMCSTMYAPAVLFPWNPNYTQEEVDEFLLDPAHYGRLLVGHGTPEGAMLPSGIPYNPSGKSWVLRRDVLERSKFARIALGDCHKRQDLFGGRGGCVGAFMQHNFGEEGNPQGVEVWDDSAGVAEWIELDGARRYRTIEWHKDGTEPVPHPRFHTKVRPIGWEPGRVIRAKLEEAGMVVETVPKRAERIARAEIEDHKALDTVEAFRLWAATQEPAWTEEQIERHLVALGGIQ